MNLEDWYFYSIPFFTASFSLAAGLGMGWHYGYHEGWARGAAHMAKCQGEALLALMGGATKEDDRST